MAETTSTLILGAGLTGLSCAHHLGDRPYRLLERSDGVGGLARTRQRPNGFLCDGTGHWLHLRKEPTQKLVHGLLGDNLKLRERKARVYSKGTFTLYPFQANTYGLPKEVVKECVMGLVQARYEEDLPEPQNYKEWIRKEFGEGICKHFMYPYNQKIYGVPLDTLATDFAAKYIPRPALEAVLDGALGLSKEALGYNAKFLYPIRGGIGAMAEALHAGLPVKAELGRAPEAVSLADRVAVMPGGHEIRFEHLVSTIPLPNLVDLVARRDPVPDSVRDAKAKMRANSVLYFDVGIEGPPKEHQDYHWIYVPEPEFRYYRVGSYTAVEPSLAPEGCRSYYVELGHYGDVDQSRFEEPVLEGLRKIGIIDDDSKVLFMIPNVLSPAYVLFDNQYARARDTVLDWVESHGTITMGRYGRWQYNAMEDALLEGMEAANRIAERTSTA